MNVVKALAFIGCTLSCQFAHATRQEYWDLAWVMRVATVCSAQNAGFRNTPLGKAASLSPDTAGSNSPDKNPSTECLKQLDRMPESVCAAMASLDLTGDLTQMKEFREKYEVEAWRAEQALAYLEADEWDRANISCPITKKLTRPADAPPLNEKTAACPTVTPVQANDDERRVLNIDMSSLSRLAEDGDLLAQNELGRRYGLGTWVAKNSVVSFTWYRRAAEKGLGIAQANLAYMYWKGEGVERDLDMALEWAKKSAAQGNHIGQLTVGHMYANGIGATKDGRKAERCYLLAAKQGNPSAQETLAKMYSRGDGVPVNKDLSVIWFKRFVQSARTGKPWKEEIH